jgi:hypothetical protein
MTITFLAPDGVAVSAQRFRQAHAALYGGGSGRRLGVRSGFRVDTPSTILTATSTTWTLTPCAAEIDPGASTHQGGYGWSSDANETGSVTAADATYARKDIVYIQINDSSAGDGSGALTAPVLYLAGTPASTPVAPTLPARSFLVGTISVPNAGGGSPTVILNPARFAAAGGILPISSSTERDALTPYDGMPIVRTDYDGALEVYDGAEWGGPLTSATVPPPDGGWQIDGGVTRMNAQGFKQCHATLKLTRIGAPAATINQTYNALLAATIPAAYRPVVSVQGHAVMSTTGGTFRANLECLIGTNGDIAFRVESGSVTLAANDVFYVDMSWWQ